MNKFYKVIDKIGKRNFILLVFIFGVIIIAGLYQTFSLFTESNGTSIADGVKTFKFILGNDTENSVTIAAGTRKNVAITVSNLEKTKLKYGIYYSSSDALTDVDLGYKQDTEYLPNGLIESNQNYIVTIEIENNSTSNITIHFGMIYGLENGGDLVLGENQHWLNAKWNFPLAEVELGSYVKYIGNNGCSGMACTGQNANYVDDTNMGYCTSNNKFRVNGWRLAYVKNDTPYIISGASPECLCTNNDGTSSSTSCATYDTTSDISLHFSKLDSTNLKYCNIGYIYEGLCNNNNVHNINGHDFKMITSTNIQECRNVPSQKKCGAENTLIDTGNNYWFQMYSKSPSVMVWFDYYSTIGNSFVGGTMSNMTAGIRPILKISPKTVITAGKGTYKDPYIIDNPDTIKDLSGNMNNGVNEGGAWNKKDGNLTTDGNSTYVDCGLVNYSFGNQASFVLRINIKELLESGAEQDLFNNFEGTGVGLFIKNRKVGFSVYSSGAYHNFYSNAEVAPNNWYTIIGTYNGSEMSIYVNGTKAALDPAVGGGNTTSASGDIAPSIAPIAIGMNSTRTGSTLGTIAATYSDALIFNRVLTESEIQANYSGEVNPVNKESLLLYYDFKR